MCGGSFHKLTVLVQYNVAMPFRWYQFIWWIEYINLFVFEKKQACAEKKAQMVDALDY